MKRAKAKRHEDRDKQFGGDDKVIATARRVVAYGQSAWYEPLLSTCMMVLKVI